MKNSAQLKALDYVVALLSGLALAASLPPSPFDWLAWFSLAPLFRLLENKTIGPAFRLGWIWGVAHFLALIYWIVVALGHYGNLSAITSLVPLALLVFYLALYPALFCCMAVLFRNTTLSFVWISLAWVALEYGRARVLTGFPWCLAGYSQYGHHLLIQVAKLTGVYGISFIIVLVNWLCYRVLLASRRASSQDLSIAIALTGLCIAGTLLYGYHCLNNQPFHNSRSLKDVTVAIVQPGIDQSVKWNPRFQRQTMELYEHLSRKAAKSHPDLLVWPETATPFFFQDNKILAAKVTSLTKEFQTPLLFGSPAYKRTVDGIRYFNRAYLLRPDQKALQHYDKVHLVPFGEYVPLRRFLFFVNKLVPGAGDFQSGSRVNPLRLDDISCGVLICFEAIFPELARVQMQKGANMLVNLTNDAWFGKTSAPYQHLAMAVFRAVENSVPLIRAANTGFSAFIDASGRIQKKSGLFTKEVLIDTVQVPSAFHPTPYTRYGDIFAKGSILISLMALILSLLFRRRNLK
ncbi:MAG: apolipoprotein N-acyltransferase [Deltaproteobacteria bacterium]|nr:apolipoprotein N-acyltransferase [Deltaproteobacteria bacterium]MBW1929469.1 apolipoprotein N-acyltransferase [Deltaproteobacteria bacterium]MBW2023872.1 apolipoprotein N-acyltransferase [Deltaproteobacteria bacterium]MBW2124161.1 apolipoprotein N-acyltransferase [Deltaproteobacteria bacterium]